MLQKLLGLLVSKRMIGSAIAAVIKLFGEQLGIDPVTVDYLAGVILAWVAGDALDPTTSILKSRRFWIAAIAVLAGVLATLGIPISPEALQEVLLPIIVAITGASLRPVLAVNEKLGGKPSKSPFSKN